MEMIKVVDRFAFCYTGTCNAISCWSQSVPSITIANRPLSTPERDRVATTPTAERGPLRGMD